MASAPLLPEDWAGITETGANIDASGHSEKERRLQTVQSDASIFGPEFVAAGMRPRTNEI